MNSMNIMSYPYPYDFYYSYLNLELERNHYHALHNSLCMHVQLPQGGKYGSYTASPSMALVGGIYTYGTHVMCDNWNKLSHLACATV